MIETARIGPGLHVVASLAPDRTNFSARLGHAVLEFASVGIHVTGSATKVFEAKR